MAREERLPAAGRIARAERAQRFREPGSPPAAAFGIGFAESALAKAVLGGIAFGTCSTLLFVPFLYTVLRRGDVKPLEEYV